MNHNAYRNAIRDLIELIKARGTSSQMIAWQIGEDEVNDPTLVSLRAYGSREHADVVMVACGVSGIWEPLPPIIIVMPKLLQVQQLRRQYGLP
jgi:hypothetical protein